MGTNRNGLQLHILDKVVVGYAKRAGYSKYTVVNMALRDFFKTNQMEMFEAKPEGVA